MPVGPGKFRVLTTKTGKKVRLHFLPNGQVDEAKNLKTGATHTRDEFADDRLAGVMAKHAQAGTFKKTGKKARHKAA